MDVILFTGDAYVDHPSFGAAVIGRIIESEGFRIAIVPQPNWRDDLRDFKKLGKPKLFFAVTAGNMDSMVNHYTAFKRKRSDDAYTPGGKAGFRPDYASVKYSQILKSIYPEIPVVLGGVEASMRRISHYDYWDNKMMPSVLIDSAADLLVYGMGEQAIREILRLMNRGVPFDSLDNIPQTALLIDKDKSLPKNKKWKTKYLPSHEEVVKNKKQYAESFMLFEKESNKINSARLIQEAADKNVVVNPPFPPPGQKETDFVYDLPFTRLPHPKYNGKGAIPAYEMIKFSVNMHRGCFGGCSFCAIAAHQGKHVSSRSEESVLREIESISGMADFKGVLSDLGGPSANMYHMKGIDIAKCVNCARPSCIWPSVCNNLHTDHGRLNNLLERVRALPYIKKVFVSSGIRYDLCLHSFNGKAAANETAYLENVIRYHTSGRFKVAPEHTHKHVLDLMRKPSFGFFRELMTIFHKTTRKYKLNYEIIPYFISSHPGTTNADMAELSLETSKLGVRTEQVQDFTPTPGTLSTAVFYTGIDPYSGKKIGVASTEKEKRDQNLFFFWHKKEYRKRIEGLIRSMGRKDLLKQLFGKKQ